MLGGKRYDIALNLNISDNNLHLKRQKNKKKFHIFLENLFKGDKVTDLGFELYWRLNIDFRNVTNITQII